MLAGRQQDMHAERDRTLEEAQKQRQIRRQLVSLTFSGCPFGVVLDIRTSPVRVRSLNFRLPTILPEPRRGPIR